MSYISGDRNQLTMLPPVIDDYIGAQDPVRVYDAFIEAINFDELGISLKHEKAGAKSYSPKSMLKLLVYGYSYGGTRSSRKLERACHHNLSFIWLLCDLKPDYRTIGRFRKDNEKAIKQVLRQIVKLCIKLGMIEGNSLFIDGSKFRANANISKSWDKERCDKAESKIEENIERIMNEAGKIDKEEEDKGSLVELQTELTTQKEMRETVRKIASELESTNKRSINTTDPDSVKAKSRQGRHASFNAQISADAKHGLIVSSDVVNQNNDLNQLSVQVQNATEVLEKPPKSACSDAGYYSLKDLDEIPDEVELLVPGRGEAQREKSKEAIKPFEKEAFKYDEAKDEYICPEGKRLVKKGLSFGDPRKRAYKAKSKECVRCKNFGVCTKNKDGRRIIRMKEEELKEELSARYNSAEGQEKYKLRKEKVELPFGHMKRNLGAGQFMLRGLEGVNAEFSILSTCFNISRAMTIKGIDVLLRELNGRNN